MKNLESTLTGWNEYMSESRLTSENLRKWQEYLQYVSRKLNELRCQIDEYNQNNNGPLKNQFDRSQDTDIWGFTLGMKSRRAMAALVYLRPRTLHELTTFTSEDLRNESELFTKKVIAEIQTALHEKGLSLAIEEAEE